MTASHLGQTLKLCPSAWIILDRTATLMGRSGETKSMTGRDRVGVERVAGRTRVGVERVTGRVGDDMGEGRRGSEPEGKVEKNEKNKVNRKQNVSWEIANLLFGQLPPKIKTNQKKILFYDSHTKNKFWKNPKNSSKEVSETLHITLRHMVVCFSFQPTRTP
jgi:hypothetical protein